MASGRLQSTLENTLPVLDRFWGRPEYSGFHVALRGWKSRKVVGLVQTMMRLWPTRCLALAATVLFLPKLPSVAEPQGIIVFAPTQTNKAAVEPMIPLLPHASVKILDRKPSFWERLGALKGLFHGTNSLSAWRDAEAFLSAQVLIGAASVLFFDHALRRCTAQLVIVANDHSPISCALMKAAQAHGKKVAYVQHAPVSSAYPRLTADLNVLWDDASLEAYSRNHQPAGAVVVMSPFTTSPKPIAPMKSAEVWGVCLSRVSDLQALKVRLEQLCGRPDTKRVLVRPHPAITFDMRDVLFDDCIEIDGQTTVHHFAEKIDAAIVPGSGIAIELLHEGVPTFYVSDIDRLGHDPHHLVRGGILPDLTARSLAEIPSASFEFFDEAWKTRFFAHDASQTRTLTQMRQAVTQAFERLTARDKE